MTLPPWPTKKHKNNGKPKSREQDKIIDALEQGTGAIVTPEIIKDVSPELQGIVQDEENIAFKPNEGPQTDFLASSEREVLYGGAKGGGKSYALLIDPLRYMNCRHSRAMIIRRSTPDLRDMVAKAQYLYPKAYPKVKWNQQQNMFTFPSGARIEFTFCETTSDLPRFQGQNMTYCGIDEAASHPYLPELLNYIRSNIRSVDPINAPPMLRMTANPGEVSSMYLRKDFVEKGPANQTFWEHVKLFDNRTKKWRIVNISKKYIPATIFDNEHLLKDDSYLATLASLPETKRKQWLEGNWFVSEMSAFPEFDEKVHVVSPFEISRDWKRIKGQDWGFSTDGCVLWGAVRPNGQLVIYREFVFKKKDAMTVAQEGKSMEIGEPRSLGIIDASAFQQRGTLGQSIGELMQQYWPSWQPSSRSRMGNNSSRAHRKNLVHTHLALNPETGEPRMVIFPNCRKLIEALSALPLDKNNPETVDTDSPLDHYFDALSYLLQGRPVQLRAWTDPFVGSKTEATYRVNDAIFGY
jgi:Terminase large subunit, T4likevirus-type, N-terminal